MLFLLDFLNISFFCLNGHREKLLIANDPTDERYTILAKLTSEEYKKHFT
jgi:hypothetical protein